MKSNILSLAFLFLFTVIGQAQIDRSKQPEPGPAPTINLGKPYTFKLSNGLKVLVVENHKLPRVSASLRIDNPPHLEGDKAGLSSLIASMMGNGTTSIEKDAYNDEVDFLGARIGFGSSSAFASSLSKYFPRVLELMADGVKNPLLTQEELDAKRDQSIEGLKADEKNVGAAAGRVRSALAYGTNHPYGEFETKETYGNVTLEDVKKYHRDFFAAENAYLVIVGDVNPKDVKKLVKKEFQDWRKAAAPAVTYSDPKNVQYTQVNFVDMSNAVQSEISVVNTTNLKMGDADYFPTLIANQILGGGGEGRLFLNLREDKAFTYGAYSSVGSNKYGKSLFRAGATVRNAVTDSAVVEFLNEINKIRDEKVSAEDLKNTKAKYVGRFVRALERPETIANYALNIETQNLPDDYYETYLQKIEAVTIDDVQQAAQKHFAAKNARVIVTGKGSEIAESLSNMSYNGKPLPIKFYDKNGKSVPKPDFNKAAPEGVTAKSVLQKYIDAIGGADKLSKVSSVLIVGEAKVQGMTLAFEQRRTSKKQFSQDVKMGANSVMKQVLNQDKGYMMMQGQKMDMDTNMVNGFVTESYPFYEMKFVNNADIKFEGIEQVDGKDAYKIKLNDTKSALYDVETGLKVKDLTKVSMGGQTVESGLGFGDYKEVGGIKFPFLYKQSQMGQTVETVVKEIKVNEGVSDADFN